MTQRTRLGRRLAGLGIGAGLAIASVVGLAAPAQAYSPDPSDDVTEVSTNSSHYYHDVIDDTYFKRDPGGEAVKIELRQDGLYLGKVEFHPYSEKLYVYDTYNDGDSAVYGILSWHNDLNNRWVRHYFSAPATGNSVDMRLYDLSIPDGKSVSITLYDNSARTDHVATGHGHA